MMVPTMGELKNTFASFIAKEGISWRTLLHPRQIIGILFRHKFLHFLVVGIGGVAINLFATWVLTEFVFGLEQYFLSYLIGTAINLVFNFAIFSMVIFQTSHDHFRRLFVYLMYIVSVIAIQAYIVKSITPLVGLHYYLLVIAGIIGIFSVINFMVFKLSIFKERTL